MDLRKIARCEFSPRYCDKATKTVLILREKRLFIVHYSFVKENKEISQESSQTLMNLDLNLMPLKFALSQDSEKIIFYGSNKVEAGFVLAFAFQNKTLISVEISKMLEVKSL